MTKISKKAAYPIKNPVVGDYFVGTDSENNNKTVNFGFEYAANLINRLNGTLIINYIFRTDVNINLAVLTGGTFLSAENETNVNSLTQLYVNKNNFQDDDLSELFLFIKDNTGDFYFKLQNSNNLNNAAYFKIASIVSNTSHFIFNIELHKGNPALSTLTLMDIYFFSFEIKPNITKTSDLENDGENGTDPFITAEDLPEVPEYTMAIVANQIKLYKDAIEISSQDLSVYLDDTNLARLVSGTLNPATGIATFTRDDASTFTIDFSGLIDVQPTNTSDLTNDGANGTNPFITAEDLPENTSDLVNDGNGTGSPFATEQYVDDADDALDSRIEILENFTPVQDTGFTGKAYAAWSGTGLVYDVTVPSYYLDNVLYPADTGQVTLDAADVTNPRLDSIIVDASGINKVSGIAEENPVSPTLDPSTQLFITNVLILAGATTPANTSQSLIYDEGTEWTTYASNGAITFNNTVSPLNGTNCVNVLNSVNNSYAEFTAPAPQSIVAADGLKVWVKLTSAILANRGFSVSVYNGTTRVSNIINLVRPNGTGGTVGAYGIQFTNTTNYQLIVIPFQDLNLSNATYNKVRITFVSTISAKFDYLALITSGGSLAASPDKKGFSKIVTDSGLSDATTAEDTITMTSPNDGLVISAIGKIITFTSLFTSTLKTGYDAAKAWVDAHPNVDNTSDLNKPVSTATQAALDLKVDKDGTKVLSDNNYSNVDKDKVSYITITQAVNLDDIETRVNDLDAAVILKGTWSAAGGTFPGSGVAQAGWSYLVTADGTVDGIEIKDGDRIIAVTDNASTSVYAGNWYKADYTDRVNTVAGRTGNVVITSSDLSDFNSAVNALIATAISGKQNTLVAGTNITIDNTNPAAPVINASGGGGGETATSLGALIGSAGDATPNDTDFIATSLTAGGILKKITWASAKAFLKIYNDTQYTLKTIQVTGITLSSGGWSAVSGFYEYDLSNANITATSVVDVIPENASIENVKEAGILPKTLSSSGSVKLYATNLPTNNISVTINILK